MLQIPSQMKGSNKFQPNVANSMEKKVSRSKVLQRQLKWRLPAPKCCKLNGERAENRSNKLDDGWPKSVEEQTLLLLALRHHIRKQYIQDVL